MREAAAEEEELEDVPRVVSSSSSSLAVLPLDLLWAILSLSYRADPSRDLRACAKHGTPCSWSLPSSRCRSCRLTFCNPSVRWLKRLKLPSPPSMIGPPGRNYFGYAYNPSADLHTLLRIQATMEAGVSTAWVLTLPGPGADGGGRDAAAGWRKLELQVPFVPDHYCHPSSDGIMYWLARDDERDRIYSFDTRDEKFRLLLPPPPQLQRFRRTMEIDQHGQLVFHTGLGSWWNTHPSYVGAWTSFNEAISFLHGVRYPPSL